MSEPVHIIIFIHAISAFITQLTISYGVNHRVNDLTALKQVFHFFSSFETTRISFEMSNWYFDVHEYRREVKIKKNAKMMR